MNKQVMNNLLGRNFTQLLVLLFIFPLYSIGQSPNTLVMGTINNSLAKHIEIQVNQGYLRDATDLYKSNVLGDGSFMFGVEINEPQLVKIIYARNEALIYLEPHDTLVINSDANSFQFSLKFSGRGGANNTCLFKHFKMNPPIMNAWELTQYQKGIFWFANELVMDGHMQQLQETQFVAKIGRKKDKSMSELLRFQNQNTENLTPDFINFLETDIYFDWAYHMLLYGSVYGNMHQLDQESFFKFLDDMPINDKMIGSYWYRNFLLGYVNHISLEEKKEGDEYVKQYQLAETLLQEKSKAFVRAHLVYKAFYAKRVDQIIPSYLDFLETNPYPLFDEKVTGAYEKAMKYAIGAPAPDFSIAGMENETVGLLDFQGKVVLLNFWASWCRPCMKKMNQMRPMQRELESQNIIFLNVSLDRNKTDWMNSINANGFQGVHVMADGSLDSRISTLYEVKALPQYFIIDKHGNFAEKPRSKDLNDLKRTLEYLNIKQ